MKASIKLTDTHARIASIDADNFGDIVILEWGGPSDRTVTDFELARLGRVVSSGGNQSTGYVILSETCKMQVGDVIQLCDRALQSCVVEG